jgi:hypothetical protein
MIGLVMFYIGLFAGFSGGWVIAKRPRSWGHLWRMMTRE